MGYLDEIRGFIDRGVNQGYYVGIFCLRDYNGPTWEVECGEVVTYYDTYMEIHNYDTDDSTTISYRDITHLIMQEDSFYDDDDDDDDDY